MLLQTMVSLPQAWSLFLLLWNLMHEIFKKWFLRLDHKRWVLSPLSSTEMDLWIPKPPCRKPGYLQATVLKRLWRDDKWSEKDAPVPAVLIYSHLLLLTRNQTRVNKPSDDSSPALLIATAWENFHAKPGNLHKKSDENKMTVIVLSQKVWRWFVTHWWITRRQIFQMQEEVNQKCNWADLRW
jgi:hypothetical protein